MQTPSWTPSMRSYWGWRASTLIAPTSIPMTGSSLRAFRSRRYPDNITLGSSLFEELLCNRLLWTEALRPWSPHSPASFNRPVPPRNWAAAGRVSRPDGCEPCHRAPAGASPPLAAPPLALRAPRLFPPCSRLFLDQVPNGTPAEPSRFHRSHPLQEREVVPYSHVRGLVQQSVHWLLEGDLSMIDD